MNVRIAIQSLLLLLTSTAPLPAQSYYNFRDSFLDRKGEVQHVQLKRVEENLVTETLEFVLRSTKHDSLTGRLRRPKGEGPFPVALLTVGIETGKDVIAMIEGQDSVFIVAIDYPFEGEWNFEGWAAVGTTFRLRSMGFRTVPLLLNLIDWIFTLKDADRSDVSVIAVSFGVFTGIPAAVIDQRVCRLVVVQGGGNLSGVLAHNSERWGVTIPSWLAGWLGGAILAPFEPNKYVPHLSPRPLLIISGEGDTFFPPESARSLYEHAREPKEIFWHQSHHVAPGEKELIKELTNIVARRLYTKTQ